MWSCIIVKVGFKMLKIFVLYQYTLAVTVPTANMYQFHGQLEIRRDARDALKKDITEFFERLNEPRRWRLNPDWTYCEYIHRDSGNDNTTVNAKYKEDLMIHFLRRIQSAEKSWAWRNIKSVTKNAYNMRPQRFTEDIYSCK